MTDDKLITEIAKLSIPVLPEPLIISGDWLIVGDAHVPFTDWEFALRVVQVGRKERVRNLLLAGDFWNYDHLSLYESAVGPPTWATERAAGKRLVQAWGEWFTRIEALTGNHERRKSRRTDGNEDNEDIFSPLAAVHKNLHSTIYGWAEIYNNETMWHVTHPRNYSVNQLTVADQLALKLNRNVISAHEHHLSIGWDRYGRHVIANLGCLVDADKLAYVRLDDSKSGAMVKGFGMLKDGVCTLFGEYPFTDWRRYDGPARGVGGKRE